MTRKKSKNIDKFLASARTPLLASTQQDWEVYKHAAEITRDMRGFVICRHADYGFLLLRSFKRKSGENFQLPGGRAEPEDATVAKTENLEEIAQVVAARELFEETGIDVRNDLSRLTSLKKFGLQRDPRYYFEIWLTQSDEVRESMIENDGASPSPKAASAVGLTLPITGEPFHILLSTEHTGFCFVKDLDYASDLISEHSAGHSSTVLRAYGQLLKQRSLIALNSPSLLQTASSAERSSSQQLDVSGSKLSSTGNSTSQNESNNPFEYAYRRLIDCCFNLFDHSSASSHAST